MMKNFGHLTEQLPLSELNKWFGDPCKSYKYLRKVTHNTTYCKKTEYFSITSSTMNLAWIS
jgi:hypothetical protein